MLCAIACLNATGVDWKGYFIFWRITVCAILSTDLYRRLLLSPLLNSEPLLAIRERYVETVLRLIGSFISCSKTDCISREENHTNGKLFWITDLTFANSEAGTPVVGSLVALFAVSFGMPPSNSTRSSRRRALSLVIWPSKATVYRLPSLSNSSTRIFFAGKRFSTNGGVHKLCTSHLKAVMVNCISVKGAE